MVIINGNIKEEDEKDEKGKGDEKELISTEKDEKKKERKEPAQDSGYRWMFLSLFTTFNNSLYSVGSSTSVEKLWLLVDAFLAALMAVIIIVA